MRRLIAALAALVGGLAGSTVPASAVAAPADTGLTVFGIRLGVPLESQMPACAGDAWPDDGPCWTADARGRSRTARVSRPVFAEFGPVWVKSVREEGGVVVEVEAEFPPAQSRRVERHLRRTLGEPAESERYERASRAFGLKRLQFHTWRGGGTTLHFDEQSASDQGLVRAYLDRWAAEQRQRAGS